MGAIVGTMARHKRIVVEFPDWVDASKSACLRSVAEDAYIARAMAMTEGASQDHRCTELMRAGEKSLRKLEDAKAGEGVRCREGDRAARKFWEAKVCARR
jgi:hypothetical protein